jgi:hypothetical protein
VTIPRWNHSHRRCSFRQLGPPSFGLTLKNINHQKDQQSEGICARLLDTHFPEDAYKQVSGKLHIYYHSYCSVEGLRQTQQSTFASNADLLGAMVKSSAIPGVTRWSLLMDNDKKRVYIYRQNKSAAPIVGWHDRAVICPTVNVLTCVSCQSQYLSGVRISVHWRTWRMTTTL